MYITKYEDLMDVVYLLRKQKMIEMEFFTVSPKIIDKLYQFINKNAYSLRNLMSLVYSLEILNLNTK